MCMWVGICACVCAVMFVWAGWCANGLVHVCIHVWGVVAHWQYNCLSFEGSLFESHYSHHLGTLDKSFTRSCL